MTLYTNEQKNKIIKALEDLVDSPERKDMIEELFIISNRCFTCNSFEELWLDKKGIFVKGYGEETDPGGEFSYSSYSGKTYYSKKEHNQLLKMFNLDEKIIKKAYNKLT